MKHRALATLSSVIFAVSCTAAPAATTSAPSTVAAATASPTPTATPCPRVYVAPTAAPTGTPVPSLAPEVAANTNTTTCVKKVAIPPIQGKTASIDILDIDQATHLLYV